MNALEPRTLAVDVTLHVNASGVAFDHVEVPRGSLVDSAVFIVGAKGARGSYDARADVENDRIQVWVIGERGPGKVTARVLVAGRP